MGVEIISNLSQFQIIKVMPREGHGSRNLLNYITLPEKSVMPREGHGSRNIVSHDFSFTFLRHAPRGAWE